MKVKHTKKQTNIVYTYLLVVSAIDTLRHEDRVQVLVGLELSALLVGINHHEHRQVGSEATQVLGNVVSGGSHSVLGHHDGEHGGVLSQRGSLLGSGVGHALERVLHGGHGARNERVGLCV